MNELEAAEMILDDPTAPRSTVEAAYDALKAWHEANHPATCVCQATLVLTLLAHDLLVWRDGIPRLVGAERQSATNRLLNAIIGTRRTA